MPPGDVKELFRGLVPEAVKILNQQFGAKNPVSEASLWSAWTTFERYLSGAEAIDLNDADSREALAGAIVQLALRKKWRREKEDRRWEGQTLRPLRDGERIAFDPPSRECGPDEQVEQEEHKGVINAAILHVLEELDQNCQAAIRLWWQHDLKVSQQAIAGEIGISTAKMTRCKQFFLDRLCEELAPMSET